ncbi:FtsX-like permease family protein [Alkalihalobacillus trypoxylicola]|uniref:ABC3 transporter permease C-terminal domain-containing protein n=1 Tax=Alkalihalobacillus trypoxylicola TaxID=519424 RepID=A0A162DFR7_9BACI|nr:ABC transporter permease [Alkalihalobacillus trypoxylicola]KYG29485.1 hypothetical protein AZF04_08160 [Alkalihalobacillus trypoxylicola]
MWIKLIKNDLKRKKIIHITLFIFLVLSAFCISNGATMLVKLSHSIEELFAKAEAPHFVQMHAGDIDQAQIDSWSSSSPLVNLQQTVAMINIDGTNLSLAKKQNPENNSVMDISFVKQNEKMDFLLDEKHNLLTISNGEIGVPLYYKYRDDLKIGDKVYVQEEHFSMEFTISAFVQDALMNPSLVHSKRFLINELDFNALYPHGEIEYLIQFQLADKKQLTDFSLHYQTAALPNSGPAIDSQTFMILHALSDGIAASVIILLSFLLVSIAILCLRLTIFATIEEDFQEIGVMKAIGIPPSYIKRIFLSKYIFLAAFSCLLGYLISLSLSPFLYTKMAILTDAPSNQIIDIIIPLLASSFLFLLVVSFCHLSFNRFRKISATEALREGSLATKTQKNNWISLRKNRFLPVNSFLGIQDVMIRFKTFILLLGVYIICSFLMVVPLNFLTTIESPTFISYMGIGDSDIRIDLQNVRESDQRFNEVLNYIKNDPAILAFSPLITSRFQVLDQDGKWGQMQVETGNLEAFPLVYLEGRAPAKNNEIALSYINSSELDKTVGEQLFIKRGPSDDEKQVTISGIYQDITNGGRTAKAVFEENSENILWYVISADIHSDYSIPEKIAEYSSRFSPAKVTHLESYLTQTLGQTINQVKLITIISYITGLFVSMLITILFIKMLLAKDFSQINIMRRMGFSIKDIQIQFLSRVSFIMLASVLLGTLLSNTLGPLVINTIWGTLGASQIEFVINPIYAYLLSPLFLIVSVMFTTMLSMSSLKNHHLMNGK